MRKYLIVLLILLNAESFSQTNFPELSPKGGVQQKAGFTTISIVYERPAARGRKIFDELVVYNKLWRTGAGICTKVTFDDNVVIDNKVINSGTYSLFTIPNQNEWTIIFNSDTALYGIEGYNEDKDVVRFKVKPEILIRRYESLTIDIDVQSDDAELNISWEKTRVAFKIKTETDKKVERMVNEEFLSGNVKDPQLFAMGAEYYYFLNRNLETGLALINKALELKLSSWYYSVKVDLLTKCKRYGEAIDILKLNMAYSKINPEKWNDEQLGNVLKGQEAQLKELHSKIKK